MDPAPEWKPAMRVPNFTMLFARSALVASVLTVPLALHSALMAGLECPRTRAGVATCDATAISCPVGIPCQGDGSILYDGPWNCVDDAQNWTQCVTATVPPGTSINNPICYAVFDCMWDGERCRPDDSAQPKQIHRRVAKTTIDCL